MLKQRINPTRNSKRHITARITRQVASNGYASEDPTTDLSSSNASTHARTEFAKELRLYPPSRAITILPPANSIN